MAKMMNAAAAGEDEIKARFASLGFPELMAQEIAQQAAIHALEALLKKGCSEQTACRMLADTRRINSWVREEFARRGEAPAFAEKQTDFN